jgi:serine/threonine protein kinase
MELCSGVVGKGSYGLVTKTLLDGKPVAIKEIESSRLNPLEISIMVTYDCSLLNRAIKVEIDEQGNYLIYQTLAVCDLRERLCKGKVTEEQKKSWMLDICEALLFLRKESIVHGDVKPSNILVYEDDRIKLGDFGCSVLVSSNTVNSVAVTCGTIIYNSPETLDKNEMSHKSDIWSLGCLFYELISGKKLISISSDEPRARIKALRSIQLWRNQQGDANVPKSTSNIKCLPITFLLSGVSANLINSMLCYDPSDRACITTITNHIWFRPVNLKQRVLNVHVNCLMINNSKDNEREINNYIASRKLILPPHILTKTIHLYSLMESKTRNNIECSIIIAYKLYKQDTNYYHPIAKKKLLQTIEENFYMSVSFMIHKSSFHETYVDLEDI